MSGLSQRADDEDYKQASTLVRLRWHLIMFRRLRDSRPATRDDNRLTRNAGINFIEFQEKM
jgi:hypothetical protein